MNTDQYIEKWLNGTLTEKEREQFEKTDSFKELKKLSDAIQQFKAPGYDTEAELQRLNRNKSKRGNQIKINWQKTLLRVAAMLTIVVGGYLFYTYFLPATIATSIAESKEVLLPDSSIVILNSVSKITYNKRTWDRNRNLELVGEAFFKVKKGSKFDVETSAGTVSVLGTQFNVKQRKDFFEVVCYEGLVSVKTSGNNNKLPAFYSIRIIDGKVTKSQFADEFHPVWLDNESAFTSVPFHQVTSEFERQYKVEIVPQNVDMEVLFTGRFTHDDMILALKSITIPQNITYQTTEDQQIILSGEVE
jgi:ferric-dicitrate binding protein FerR (iron transport regulator)